MYDSFVTVHRWLALAVSAFLLIVALSGSVLVLEQPLSQVYATHVAPAGTPLSLDTLAARARASAGEGPVRSVGMSDSPDVAWGISLGAPANHGVTLDPYTGAIVEVPAGDPAIVAFVRQMHLLHTRLLAGTVGRTIVAIVTIVALILVITGLIIWWREKLWRINTTASWKRVNFDLHHALGAFSAMVLVVVTATGIWVHFDGIDGLLMRMDRAPAPVPPQQAAAEPGAMPVSLDALAATARAAVPGAAITNIQLPPSDRAPAMVQLKYPDDHTPAGRSRVYIDRYRGSALLVMSTHNAELGRHMVNIKRALHTGDIYGPPTQVTWALASLALAGQVITGVLMWWNARRARARKPAAT